jgi:NMT1/THI5 like
MHLSARADCRQHTSPWRRWLRTVGAAICLGLVGALLLLPVPPAAALREIKFSHGSGLCNMPLFYAGEKQLFRKYGIEGIVVMTPLAGDSAIQLATGQVDMGVIPYTNAIAAYTRSPAFAVVSGSGIQGLMVVAKPEITSFAGLKGKKIGTFARQYAHRRVEHADVFTQRRLVDIRPCFYGRRHPAAQRYSAGQYHADDTAGGAAPGQHARRLAGATAGGACQPWSAGPGGDSRHAAR